MNRWCNIVADAFEGPRFRTSFYPFIDSKGTVVLGEVWSRRSRLPELPEGDIVVAGEAGARAMVGWGEAVERADAWLRQWPVAGLSLLTVAILLAAAMLVWR